MEILALDIGGTKAAVGICPMTKNAASTVDGLIKFDSSRYHTIEKMIDDWMVLHPQRRFDGIGAGVAGPVRNGHVHLTNLGWTIDEQQLAQRYKVPVRVCNDMEAHGWGILGLPNKYILNAGLPAPGAKALIAAGTGLGEAILGWDGTKHNPMPGEGGHASFSPCSAVEDALNLYLRAKLQGHVSWERILGGAEGFRHLTLFLSEYLKLPLAHAIQSKTAECHDWGALIAQEAEYGDKLSVAVLNFYANLYGKEAANLALKCVPSAGVYLGGGIAPKIKPWLEKNFMEGFVAKGRFSALLQQLPVYIIDDDLNGLKGAAIQLLTGSR